MRALPSLIFVFDRKKISSPSKEGAVELRITYDRKCKYISTGIRLLPKHWRKGQVTNRPDAMEINESMEILMSKARKAINDMMASGEFHLDELPKRIKASTDREEGNFIDFCQKRVLVRVYGKKDDTATRYERFMRWLRSWGEIVFFSDVTDANIIKMDTALAKTGMKNYSKWNNYHRFMNSFILDAMDEGHIKRNPYKWLHIQKDKNCGLQKYLTREELAKIENADMPTASLERVRDLFVFQTYTCLSYVDLAAFDAKNVVNGVYTSKRGKTNQEFSFILLSGAKKVLEKYGGRLPLISNVKYNEYLKLVAQAAKIDKPLTSHWARHTGATILLNDGKVDERIVSKILGHASVRQTHETYAKLLDTSIMEAMKKADSRL